MPMNRSSVAALSDHALGELWLSTWDKINNMGFITTAQIHNNKVTRANNNLYDQDLPKMAMVESLLSMHAIIQEHAPEEENTP